MEKRINVWKIVSILFLVVLLAGILCFVNRKQWFHKDKPVTDVKKDGEVIEFHVNRKFYLYGQDPFDEKAKDVKPIKEVNVVMEGKANLTEENFQGEICVEGFELGGSTQICSITKDTSDSGYEYMMFAVGANSEATKDNEELRYIYQIGITKDFKVINIWIFNANSGENEFYWAMNE